MALSLVLLDGDSHVHPDGVEISWADLTAADLAGLVTFINSASPGATMAGASAGGNPGRGLADIQSRVLDHLVTHADAPVKIVFNGFFANDIYGAFARTAAQCRDLAVQWADEVHAVAPEALLICQTVTKKGGSATVEANAEAEAFSELCFSDTEVPGTPNYITWGYAACAPRRQRIPNDATDLTVFDADESHLNNTGESREYYGHNGYEGNQFIFWRLGITGIIDMGTLSSYARTALVNHARNKGAYTPAANHYCAAFVAGVEVTGNGYARAVLANNKTTWGDAGSRAITNDVPFAFPDATASWGTIDEIRIYDASSGGNELGRHTLAASVPISDSTGPLFIDAGAIDITFAAGGFTDTVVHELLDLMFGATANSPRATVYGTYFAGDPQGAGAETSATRTEITQATTWNAAAAGLARTAAAIALADEADATHYAEYTAAAAGTLLFSAALPGSFTPPVGGVIPAGGLRTQLT